MEQKSNSQPPLVVSLATLTEQAQLESAVGPVWSLVSEDLNVNLLRFNAGDGVAEHVNSEVDVVGVVVAGEGIVALEGSNERVSVGQLFFIPKGVKRSIQAVAGDFLYLTCHQRRMGLMPTRRR